MTEYLQQKDDFGMAISNFGRRRLFGASGDLSGHILRIRGVRIPKWEVRVPERGVR